MKSPENMQKAVEIRARKKLKIKTNEFEHLNKYRKPKNDETKKIIAPKFTTANCSFEVENGISIRPNSKTEREKK
jgi:uncharacterized membrane protein